MRMASSGAEQRATAGLAIHVASTAGTDGNVIGGWKQGPRGQETTRQKAVMT